MSVKIITLDLDGTLMSPDHLTVSKRNREALKAAHDKGVKITISTGRTLSIMGDVCVQVPQVDYVMYSNGAAVLDRRENKNIYSRLMDWDFCSGILDYLNANPVFYEGYVDGFSYVQPDKAEYFIDDLLPKEFVDSLLGNMNACDDVKKAVSGHSIEKITVYSGDKEVLDRMWKHFEGMENISLASSMHANMEITKAGVDKGTALDGMCKKLGIDKNEAMCFGDAGNDIPMLKYAGYSFAMGNGTDECKRAAKHVTLSNAEDGVADAIEKFILNKKR